MDKKLEKQKLKICFVSLHSYQLLKNKNLGYAGGAEVQQIALAKELSKIGHKISFITYGENHGNVEIADGIEIVPAYTRSSVSDLSFTKKMIHIWKKMKEVDAGIYFHQAGAPGITSVFGAFHKKKIVNIIASDADVTGEIIINKGSVVGFLNKMGNWLDIKLSNIVVSQNDFQKSKLKNRFNVNSITIMNAFHIPPRCNIDDKDGFVLWVGMIREVKQPFLYLEIAKQFPKHRFVMIGGKGENPELFRKIKNAANKIPNLDFKGFVPHNRIYDYYKKAILLVNTSKTEGFPYVFQEAWVHLMPIISLNADPDKVISKYKLGYCSKKFDQMIKDIGTMLEDDKLRRTMAENGRRYVEENNDVKVIGNHYDNLFENLLRKDMKMI